MTEGKMLTVRLDPDLEKEIEKISKIEGISKSRLIRESIKEYIKNYNKPTLYDAGKDMFGKYELEDNKLSLHSEKLLRDHFKK